MSQHSYVINNDTGINVRTNINTALAAIVTNNSGATAPVATFAYMMWIDTSTSPSTLRMRDGANATWIALGPINAGLGNLPTAGGTMTGVIALLAGSNSVPGVSFTGNANTGIFSGGTNKISLTAGGTEMLRADFATYLQLLGTAGVQFPVGTTAQRPTGAAGLVRYNSDTTRFECYIGSAWVDLNNGYPVDNVITFIEQTTPANPTSGQRKFYMKNDGKAYTLSSAGVETALGSGSGSKNYFALSNANPDFESGVVTPWVTASTTFSGNSPGTLTTGGGGGITLGINGAAVLSGTKDLLVTKPASNVQGTGFASGILTIDNEDTAKWLSGSFTYKCSNTNFDASGSSTQSLETWIYDVTASTALGTPQWIQPYGYRGMNQNSGYAKCVYGFQPPSTSTQFRVVVFTNQTSALGYAVEFDSWTLGPVTQTLGAVISDWVNYTPTFTGMGTPTGVSVKSRQVGDSLQVMGNFTVGTLTASVPTMTLGFKGVNANVTMDTTKIGANQQLIGMAAQGSNSATYFGLGILAVPASTGTVLFSEQSSTASIGSTSTGASSVFFAGAFVTFEFTIPIAGWSSWVQSSADSDPRALRSTMNLITANQTIATTTATKIAFNNVLTDKNGAIQIANSRYITQISGSYTLGANLVIIPGATGNAVISLYKNGSPYKSLNCNFVASVYNPISFSWDDDAIASDYYEIFVTCPTSASTTIATGASEFNIKKMAGSNTVYQEASVSSTGYNTSAQSVPNATLTTITGWTKQKDTHTFFNAATGVATIQIPGTYQVIHQVSFPAGYTSNTGAFSAGVSQAGSVTYTASNTTPFNANTSVETMATVNKDFNCIAGDTLTLTVYQNNGAARTLNNADNGRVYYSIKRVGN